MSAPGVYLTTRHWVSVNCSSSCSMMTQNDETNVNMYHWVCALWFTLVNEAWKGRPMLTPSSLLVILGFDQSSFAWFKMQKSSAISGKCSSLRLVLPSRCSKLLACSLGRLIAGLFFLLLHLIAFLHLIAKMCLHVYASLCFPASQEILPKLKN